MDRYIGHPRNAPNSRPLPTSPIRTAGHLTEYLTEWWGIASRELGPREVLFTKPRFLARRTCAIRTLNFKTYSGARDGTERGGQWGSAVGEGGSSNPRNSPWIKEQPSNPRFFGLGNSRAAIAFFEFFGTPPPTPMLTCKMYNGR